MPEEFDSGTDQDEITNRFNAFFNELFDASDVFHLQNIDNE